MVQPSTVECSWRFLSPSRLERLILLPVLGISLLWAYWPTLGVMAEKWSSDPQYSHGYLVPAFAVVLLWLRRPEARSAKQFHAHWSGLVVLAVGAALHVLSADLYFELLDSFSLLLALAGVFLCLGGWQAVRWAWPSIAFLVFMFPLPHRVEVALSHPLQHLATLTSTYTLQTLGFPAVSEGNIILLEEASINVVEACSGLSMLMTFLALATAIALVLERPWVDKVMLVASALPIALVANVVRIVATALAYVLIGSEAADVIFHDLAGWLMMPVALGLLWFELWLLSRLFVQVERGSPTLAFGRSAGAKPASASSKKPTPRAKAASRR